VDERVRLCSEDSEKEEKGQGSEKAEEERDARRGGSRRIPLNLADTDTNITNININIIIINDNTTTSTRPTCCVHTR